MSSTTPQPSQDMVPVRIGQCRTCSSPHRAAVERGILQFRTTAAILEELPPDAGLTVRHLVEHVRRRHVPIDQQELQRFIAYRTAEVEDSIRGLSTEVAKRQIDNALLTLAAGQLRMRRGELEIRGRDVLRAMQVMERHEQTEEKVRAVEANSDWRDRSRLWDIEALFLLIGEVAGEEVMGRVIQRAGRDPKPRSTDRLRGGSALRVR